MHVLTDNFCADRVLDLLDLSIGIAVYISYARLVGQIEQRSPCVGHLHVKQGIEGRPLRFMMRFAMVAAAPVVVPNVPT